MLGQTTFSGPIGIIIPVEKNKNKIQLLSYSKTLPDPQCPINFNNNIGPTIFYFFVGLVIEISQKRGTYPYSVQKNYNWILSIASLVWAGPTSAKI